VTDHASKEENWGVEL